MQVKKTFPKNFLWGAATASYQVEGGVGNCDWTQGARDGKVPVCGSACDHYNKFEQDFDIAKSLGHNAHRLSIEWSRIEPKDGEFDQKEIEHYRSVLKALRARNLYPLVTLYHFTLPIWFANKGGWEHKDASKIFSRYCMHIIEQFGDLCDNYATINEPMILAGFGYMWGTWPPFNRFAFLRYFKVLRALSHAHKLAYKNIKEKFPKLQVGIVKHTIAYSANWNPLNKVLACCANVYWTKLFMSRVYKHCDWIGLNYYNRKIFGDTRNLPVTDFNWKIDPEGIYDALQLLARYKKPIFIAEAGCADAEDRFRADYIRRTVESIERALTDGVDVRGFCYWSLLDNYEWAEGFTKRFGLVEINYETKERTIRLSAYIYEDLIKSHQQ